MADISGCVVLNVGSEVFVVVELKRSEGSIKLDTSLRSGTGRSYI